MYFFPIIQIFDLFIEIIRKKLGYHQNKKTWKDSPPPSCDIVSQNSQPFIIYFNIEVMSTAREKQLFSAIVIK